MAAYQYRSSYYNSGQQPLQEKYESGIHRRPTNERRENRTRSSDGTISTMMSTSTGRESSATAMTEAPAYSKKIVVVGDGGCGKTCLLISYSQGYFPEVRATRRLQSAGGGGELTAAPPLGRNTCRLSSRTTSPTRRTRPRAGPSSLPSGIPPAQEEYDRLRPLSYPETDLIFVCFAIDCPNSLENVMDKVRSTGNAALPRK